MVSNLFKLLPMLLAFFFLVACERGDRGGITVGSYASSSSSEGFSQEPEFVSLVSSVGKCLSMDSFDYLDKPLIAKLSSWNCYVDSDYQQWMFSVDGEIISPNGFCLALNQPFGEGVAAVAEECSGEEDQRWYLNDLTSTIINSTEPEKCLDIWNSDIHLDGNSIQVWPCNGGPNQRWSIAELQNSFIESALDEKLSINIHPEDNVSYLRASKILDVWWAAHWQVEPSDGVVRIRNRWKSDDFIGIENGELVSGPMDLYGMNSKWVLVEKSGIGLNVFQIESALFPNVYIGLDEEKSLKVGSMSELLDGSTYWEFSEVNNSN